MHSFQICIILANRDTVKSIHKHNFFFASLKLYCLLVSRVFVFTLDISFAFEQCPVLICAKSVDIHVCSDLCALQHNTDNALSVLL